MSMPARASASVKAVQPRRALDAGGVPGDAGERHPVAEELLAGVLALDVNIARMALYASSASRTLCPVTCSERTDADATLMEQPSAS